MLLESYSRLPKKGNEGGTEKAIFDYEMQILKLLDEDGEDKKRKKYFWIKKVQVLELVNSFLIYSIYLYARNILSLSFSPLNNIALKGTLLYTES